MMRLADKLRCLGIVNNHQLLKRFGTRGKDVCVDFTRGFGPQPSRSQVYSPSHKTDPSAHWADAGCKTFMGRKADSMPEAQVWATEWYSIKEWVTSPFGGRIPKYVMDAAKAEVARVGSEPKPKAHPLIDALATIAGVSVETAQAMSLSEFLPDHLDKAVRIVKDREA